MNNTYGNRHRIREILHASSLNLLNAASVWSRTQRSTLVAAGNGWVNQVRSWKSTASSEPDHPARSYDLSPLRTLPRLLLMPLSPCLPIFDAELERHSLFDRAVVHWLYRSRMGVAFIIISSRVPSPPRFPLFAALSLGSIASYLYLCTFYHLSHPGIL